MNHRPLVTSLYKKGKLTKGLFFFLFDTKKIFIDKRKEKKKVDSIESELTLLIKMADNDEEEEKRRLFC